MNFRAYFFNNMYLNGIHNGIQAGHALDNLWSIFTEYKGKLTKVAQAKFAMLREFSAKHKTWIILKSGGSEDLFDLYKFMAGQKTYPFTMFQEPGLNSSPTSVVIILPDRMYDDVATAVGKAMVKADFNMTQQPVINWQLSIPVELLDAVQERNYTPWEREFLKRKAMCGLAS
jgi:hypothetical protein